MEFDELKCVGTLHLKFYYFGTKDNRQASNLNNIP